MRLRMLISGFRARQLAGLRIDIIMPLPRTINAIGPVQAGVEPLRRIRRDALRRQHVGGLVAESCGIFLAVEIAALPAPIGPGACKPVEDLRRTGLGPMALLGQQFGQRLLIRDRAPEERWYV